MTPQNTSPLRILASSRTARAQNPSANDVHSQDNQKHGRAIRAQHIQALEDCSEHQKQNGTNHHKVEPMPQIPPGIFPQDSCQKRADSDESRYQGPEKGPRIPILRLLLVVQDPASRPITRMIAPAPMT